MDNGRELLGIKLIEKLVGTLFFVRYSFSIGGGHPYAKKTNFPRFCRIG
jgi:hypothetical protein